MFRYYLHPNDLKNWHKLKLQSSDVDTISYLHIHLYFWSNDASVTLSNTNWVILYPFAAWIRRSDRAITPRTGQNWYDAPFRSYLLRGVEGKNRKRGNVNVTIIVPQEKRRTESQPVEQGSGFAVSGLDLCKDLSSSRNECPPVGNYGNLDSRPGKRYFKSAN